METRDVRHGSAQKVREAASPKKLGVGGARVKPIPKAKAEEQFGQSMKTTFKETLSGTNRRKRSRAMR